MKLLQHTGLILGLFLLLTTSIQAQNPSDLRAKEREPKENTLTRNRFQHNNVRLDNGATATVEEYKQNDALKKQSINGNMAKEQAAGDGKISKEEATVLNRVSKAEKLMNK